MPSRRRSTTDRTPDVLESHFAGAKFFGIMKLDEGAKAFGRMDLDAARKKFDKYGSPMDSNVVHPLDVFAVALEEPTTRMIKYKDRLVVYVSSEKADVAPDQETIDHERYSLAVSARVMELVDKLVEANPDITSTPPEALAEALVDVAIDVEADRSELADLVAPFWSAQRTQQALGNLTRSAMLDRRKTGSLLGLKTTDGDIFYPVSQFEAHNGGVRVKPDLRSFMMVLRGRDPWTIAVLLHTPAEELGRRTPLDWVRHGRDPQVLVAYAHSLNAEFDR